MSRRFTPGQIDRHGRRESQKLQPLILCLPGWLGTFGWELRRSVRIAMITCRFHGAASLILVLAPWEIWPAIFSVLQTWRFDSGLRFQWNFLARRVEAVCIGPRSLLSVSIFLRVQECRRSGFSGMTRCVS